MEPIVLQEEEFLKNYVRRIAALNPTIVLVEKTVSRLAQEMLLARGVSVMLNVKPVRRSYYVNTGNMNKNEYMKLIKFVRCKI